VSLADAHFEVVEQVVVAHVDGEIDMSNAAELRTGLAAQVSNARLGLVLDLLEVGYLDSAGIQLIYQLREELGARGQQLRLVVAPGSPIADALRFADVTRAVGALETVEDALGSFED
jgi:anti-sigma B factor antagonist